MMHPHRLTDPAAIREFVFAGNARVTLVSTKTGRRYTYQVKAPKEYRGKNVTHFGATHFVGVLSGPENASDYSYIGYYKQGSAFRDGIKSKIDPGNHSVLAWRWFSDRILTGTHEVPEGLEIWTEGRCGRCSRLLTDPTSIARGIGPECAGRL